MNRQLTQILNLSELIVESQKQLENALFLQVVKQSKNAKCPNCGQKSHQLHQNHFSLIKDLPWGDREVYLRVNRRQFKCNKCKMK